MARLIASDVILPPPAGQSVSWAEFADGEPLDEFDYCERNQGVMLLAQASAIVAEAERERATLTENTRREAARFLWRTRREGRGRVRAYEEQSKGAHALAIALAAAAERAKLAQESARATIELAIALARHIIRHEVTQSAHALSDKLSELVPSIPITSIATHPADCAQVHRRLQELYPALPFTISEDSELGRGNARVTTPGGFIDIEWERDFEIAARTLRAEAAV